MPATVKTVRVGAEVFGTQYATLAPTVKTVRVGAEVFGTTYSAVLPTAEVSRVGLEIFGTIYAAKFVSAEINRVGVEIFGSVARLDKGLVLPNIACDDATIIFAFRTGTWSGATTRIIGVSEETAGFGIFIVQDGTNSAHVLINQPNSHYISASFTLADDTAYIICIRHDKTDGSVAVRLNSSVITGTLTGAIVDSFVFKYLVSLVPLDTETLDHEIGEHMIYASAVADGNLSIIETYLSSKWGISI